MSDLVEEAAEAGLDQVVRTTRNGTTQVGYAIAYHNDPTLTVERADGSRETWKVFMVERADTVEELEYWKERALQAEARGADE